MSTASAEPSLANAFLAEFARIETPLSRAHIEDVLDRFDATYNDYAYDIDERMKLFADDVKVEDPVGIVRATNIAEIEAFFRGVESMGIRMDRRVAERIITANEAFVLYEARLTCPGMASDTMLCPVNFIFNEAGKICGVRVFLDEHSFGKPISF